MSKTIRRKNERPEWIYDESGTDYNKNNLTYGWFQYLQCEEFGGKEHKKLINVYHSDNDKYRNNAPKHFRQSLNREFRSKNKVILKKIIADDLDQPFIRHRNDANWLWW